jgi:hypothetical protein
MPLMPIRDPATALPPTSDTGKSNAIRIPANRRLYGNPDARRPAAWRA